MVRMVRLLLHVRKAADGLARYLFEIADYTNFRETLNEGL